MYLSYLQLTILVALVGISWLVAYWIGRNDEYEKFIKHRMGEDD